MKFEQLKKCFVFLRDEIKAPGFKMKPWSTANLTNSSRDSATFWVTKCQTLGLKTHCERLVKNNLFNPNLERCNYPCGERLHFYSGAIIRDERDSKSKFVERNLEYLSSQIEFTKELGGAPSGTSMYLVGNGPKTARSFSTTAQISVAAFQFAMKSSHSQTLRVNASNSSYGLQYVFNFEFMSYFWDESQMKTELSQVWQNLK